VITAKTLSARYGVKVSEDLKTGRTYQTKWYEFYKERNGTWYHVSIGRRRYGIYYPKEEQLIRWIVIVQKYLPDIQQYTERYENILKEKETITERRHLFKELPFRVTYSPLFGDIYATYWIDIVRKEFDTEEEVWKQLERVLQMLPAERELQRLLR